MTREQHQRVNNESLRILLVEDNLADANLIEEVLTEVSQTAIEFIHLQRLQLAIESCNISRYDLILLDLSLPDSQGLETLITLRASVETIPIIVLTALNDHELSIASIHQGAQDYLVKGRFEGQLLVRSIRYAIERQRTQIALQQQAQRERLLAKMIEQIRQSLDLREIIKTTVGEVRRFLNADRVVIYRVIPEPPWTIIAVADRHDNEQVISSVEAVVKDHQLSDTILSIEPSNLQHFLKDNDLSDTYHSALIVPIIANNLWGILVAYHQNDFTPWQDWEQDFLNQLADQVSIAIQQAKLYHQLEQANAKLQQLATLDGLTGVSNRRHFDEILQKEWNRALREQQPLALILCDIDFFKNYNDTYGHPTGDDCLKAVAKILQEGCQRAGDTVARYGGEEFAIILADTEAQGAFIVAQNIVKLLEELQIPHRSSIVNSYVTLSIGISSLIPKSDLQPIQMIRNADLALYSAKAQGRNQIIISDFDFCYPC